MINGSKICREPAPKNITPIEPATVWIKRAPIEDKLNCKNLPTIFDWPDIFWDLKVQRLLRVKLLMMANSVDKAQESHSIDQALEKILKNMAIH